MEDNRPCKCCVKGDKCNWPCEAWLIWIAGKDEKDKKDRQEKSHE